MDQTPDKSVSSRSWNKIYLGKYLNIYVKINSELIFSPLRQ